MPKQRSHQSRGPKKDPNKIVVSLSNAEKASAVQRSSQLGTLSTQLESDARSSCDPNRAKLLLKAVQDLQHATVS